jgi:hypothetical protein
MDNIISSNTKPVKKHFFTDKARESLKQYHQQRKQIKLLKEVSKVYRGNIRENQIEELKKEILTNSTAYDDINDLLTKDYNKLNEKQKLLYDMFKNDEIEYS